MLYLKAEQASANSFVLIMCLSQTIRVIAHIDTYIHGYVHVRSSIMQVCFCVNGKSIVPMNVCTLTIHNIVATYLKVTTSYLQIHSSAILALTMYTLQVLNFAICMQKMVKGRHASLMCYTCTTIMYVSGNKILCFWANPQKLVTLRYIYKN